MNTYTIEAIPLFSEKVIRVPNENYPRMLSVAVLNTKQINEIHGSKFLSPYER